jgi:exopolysaccharide biosynthesis predicted pyruvyltransferase EpsI
MQTISVESLLKEYAKASKKVYFRPNPGNAGDALLSLGCVKIFNDIGLQYRFVDEAFDYNSLDKSDVLVMAGGGNLVPYWTSGAQFLRSIENRQFRLVMLPQSVLGCDDLLRSLQAQDVLFLRELYSFNYVCSLNISATVLTDHDTAFVLKPLDFTKPVCATPRNAKDLTRWLLIGYHYFRSFFYDSVPAYRADAEKKRTGNSYKSNDIALVCNFGQSNLQQLNTSVYWFLKVLSWYSKCETDRLHVMVGRVLQGKSVSVFFNDYYKILGIKEFTIDQNPKWNHLVRWMR